MTGPGAGTSSLLTGPFDGYPREAGLAALFSAAAVRREREPALVWEGGALSYGALLARASRVAGALAARGVARGDFVALALPRSAEAVVGLLGVVLAGAAYVPLDPAASAAQGAAFAARCGARLVLGEGDVAALAAAGPEAAPAPGSGSGDDPAYLVFTSGTTGVPKGVVAPQRGVARLALGASAIALGAEETLLLHSPLTFDAATFEIWGALLNGARLALLPPGPPSLPTLSEAVDSFGVTTLWLTAGLFHLAAAERPAMLAPLRQLVAGGDVLAPARVAAVRARFPRLRLVNGYGPTETTTFATTHLVVEAPAPGESVPLGTPVAGTRILVLDEAGVVVPRGSAGEIAIGGDGLAGGYLGDPLLTAARFVPDPLHEGERVYRSGDRGVVGADGLLRFLGRLDRQVKVRGHRVEPEAVEAALLDHPAVRAAAVQPEEGPQGTRLVAHVSLGAPISDAAIRAHLAARLPEAAIPALFRRAGGPSLTREGKTDRGALAAGSLEERVARLVGGVLGLDAVDPDRSFFELGADSLSLVALHARLVETFGNPIPVTDLFAHPTVRALARSLNRGGGDPPPLRDAAERARLRKESMGRERARRSTR